MRQKSEAEFQQEINRAMKEMDAGIKFTQDQVLNLHERLRTESRKKVMSDFNLEKAFIAWPLIEPVLRVPRNHRQYRRLVKLLDRLIGEVGEKKNHPLASLMEVLGVLIEKYEDRHLTKLA